MAMADADALRSIVLTFRLSELQALLTFAGKCKTGKKSILQKRALELVQLNTPDIRQKIRELSNTMYKSLSGAPSVNPYSSSYSAPAELTRSRSGSSLSSQPQTTMSRLESASHDSAPSSRHLGSTGRSSGPVHVGGSSSDSHRLLYPTATDVKLKKLPFHKLTSTLMAPMALQPKGPGRNHENQFFFYLSPGQASEIVNSTYRDTFGRPAYKRQIQVRFSLLETSSEQDDNFPLSVHLKVNNKIQVLPNPIPTNKAGVEPRRPPKPIDITTLCKLSPTQPNYLEISWASEIGRGYTISVYLVDKVTPDDLMKELRSRGIRHPDYTRALIKEKLNDRDNDVMTTSCKVTLACPLGKMRMSYPCRASTCDHLQCFDGNLYLMMNERKPKWLCPVCNRAALFENLQIDGFFKEVLTSSRLPNDDHEIVLHSDGSWDPLPSKKDTPPSPPPVSQSAQASNVETLSVDDDEAPAFASAHQKGPQKDLQKRAVDCITLDSDSSDDDLPLSAARIKRQRPLRFFDDSPDSSELSSVLASTPSTSPPPQSAPLNLRQYMSPQRLNDKSGSPIVICLDD